MSQQPVPQPSPHPPQGTHFHSTTVFSHSYSCFLSRVTHRVRQPAQRENSRCSRLFLQHRFEQPDPQPPQPSPPHPLSQQPPLALPPKRHLQQGSVTGGIHTCSHSVFQQCFLTVTDLHSGTHIVGQHWLVQPSPHSASRRHQSLSPADAGADTAASMASSSDFVRRYLMSLLR